MRTMRAIPIAVAASLLVTGAGCSPDGFYPCLRATPSIELAAGTTARAGHVIVMHYRWLVDPEFKPPARPHRVFVHFLLADGRLAFTDDHAPDPPLVLWKPGRLYSYSRSVVLPDRVERLSVSVGLFSSRFPFKARVLDPATGRPAFPMLPDLRIAENPGEAEEAVSTGVGFLSWVKDGRAAARASSWAGPRASFRFLQRPEGTTLLLQGYTERGRFPSDPTLVLRVGGRETREVIPDDNRRVLRLQVPGDGSTAIVEGSLSMDTSFTAGGRTLAYCVERFRAVSSSAVDR